MIRFGDNAFRTWDFEKKVQLISLLIFLVSAFFSIGHHASDEHYQIVEFAQYKLGYVAAEGLPWEFSEQMRPSLQPWIVYIAIKIFNSAGLANPFMIALIFRIISAVAAWIIIGKLNKLLVSKYFPHKPWSWIFYILTYLLWFIPYISVRFSSENFAGIFLLAGVYSLIKNEKNSGRFFLAGVFLGLSVLFRYQLGVAVLGIGAWMIFFEKIGLKKNFLAGLGILIVMLAGVFLDYLFYNEFVLTTLNYFKLNLVEDRASAFGIKPWWFYFVYFILVGIPPLSLILFIFFFLGLNKLRTNIFTCLIIPFIVIHLIIPHKEIRFLFPVFYPFIFIAMYGMQSFFKGRMIKKYQSTIFKIGLIINFIVLAVRVFLPANEKINYYRYLYNHFEKADYLVVTTEKDTYKLVGDLRASFYQHPSARSLYFNTLDELRHYLLANKVEKCFLLQRDYSAIDLSGFELEKVYSIYPDFLRKIGSVDIEKRVKPWSIYLVKGRKAD